MIGKKEFHPANPKKLFDLIKEKESIIKEALSDLQRLYEKTREEIQAEIYKGNEGMTSIFEDILNRKEWFALGARGRQISLCHTICLIFTKR